MNDGVKIVVINGLPGRFENEIIHALKLPQNRDQEPRLFSTGWLGPVGLIS